MAAGDTVTVFDGTDAVASKVVPAGATTVTFNSGATDTDFSLASDGNHTFTATATGPVGNRSAASEPFAYYLDTGATGPTLVSKSPDGSSPVKPPPKVSATYDEPLSSASNLSLRNRVGNLVAGSASVSGNTVTFTPAAPLNEAGSPYTATADVKDVNGNQTESTWTFTVDTTAPGRPAITGVEGDATSPAVGNDTTPTIVVSGVSGGDTVTIFEGTTAKGTKVVPADDDTVTFNAAETDQDVKVTADGDHTFTATATDVAGNASATSTGFVYTLDTAAPEAPSIASVAGDTTSPAAGTDSTPAIVVTGVAAGDTVTILEGTTALGSKAVPAGATSVTFNAAEDSAEVVLTGAGDHALAAKTSDAAGNASPASGQFVYRVISFEGTFHPLPPARILDTRTGTGAPRAPLGPNRSMDLTVTGVGGVPASGVTAVVMNVTVTEPTASSYLTAWPKGQPQPNASNLNFVAGQTVPNLVVAKVGTGGVVQLYNFAGSTHVVADVVGWFNSE